MSRKFLVLLLVCAMCFSMLASCSSTETTSTPASTQTAVSTQPNSTTTATPDNSDPVDTSPIVNPFADEKETVKKEHVMLETLPSSATLVGSYSLPPIDNQGSVGSCASQSIAYTQFSNAVSRYLHSIDANSKFNPAEDDKYCFSPKFTYTYSSAGTEWVYKILMDHGCLTLEDSGFYKIGTGSSLKEGGKYAKKSIKWNVEAGLAQKALQYRVTDYEQIWFTSAPYNGEMTTSKLGKDLLFKIKEAVATGNVVVTGGYPSRWQYGKVVNGGELGKTMDSIITHSVAEGDGGHQVTIVGYDDNIVTKLDGVTLKGAFLMANSWGTTYQNDGYVWVAYDALNTVSEFEELNAEEYNRGWTFDQFCFTYWDSDIVAGYPELMAEIEVESNNRASFYATLTREDSNGIVESHMPYLFYYGVGGINIHEDKEYGKYVNFGGDVEGGADTGYITLSYQTLLETIPQGATYENYIWGLNIKSSSSQYEAKIKSIKLINAKGEIVSQITPHADNVTITGGKETNYTFNLGSEIKSYRINGNYAVKNTNAGKYITVPRSKIALANAVDSIDSALTLQYNAAANNYYITKAEKDNIVFDISGKDVKAGVEIKLNAKQPDRTTQTWKLKDNKDGTYSIYLEQTGPDGRYYAYGVKDGKMLLVSGADVKTYGCFTFEGVETTSTADVKYDVKISDKNVEFKVNSLEKDVTFKSVVVCDSTGKNVSENSASGQKFEKTFTLEKGTYTINVLTERHSYVYVVTVK